MSSSSPLRRTAERFEHFATAVYPGKSPLYATLAAKIAEDPELLELAAAAEEKDRVPRPNLTGTFLPGSNSGLIATDRLQLQPETRGTDLVVDGKCTTLY